MNVPVYGRVEPPLDTDEEAAASLPPKHLFFPVVKLQDTGMVTSVGNHKIRWDRCAKRDFQDGIEVTEKEEPQTMGKVVEENKYREIYNKDINTVSFSNMRPT